MTYLLTAAQMVAIEQAAIAAGAVSGGGMMDKAGRGVVAAIGAAWPELALPGGEPPDNRGISSRKIRRRAIVFCGPGNNGGDGYVVARLLHEAGWQVDVLALAETGAPDARAQEALWRTLGPVHPLTVAAVQGLAAADLHVDALFGTGLSRPLTKEVGDVVASLAALALPRLVAVDLPSGLSADSGLALGPVPRAVLTVTFDSPKLGHYLAQGPDYCGRLVVVDIGTAVFRDDLAQADVGTLVDGLSPDTIRRLGKGQGHKYSHGHALVLSGGAGQGGAGRLAARAALRIGAGAVTLGCAVEAMPENAAQLTAVMLRAVADGADLSALLVERRIAALCLGPGLGMGPREAGLVAAALAADGPALVLDADALTLLARDGDLFATLHARCVLTPHDGEFARLFPDLAEMSRVDAVRRAAARAGCTVLRKGPDTVIAAPDGRCFVHGAVYDRSAPWLATAGSGDVLAGIITGLLARGFAPMEAATTGAFLHTSCALAFGPGLIAEDLPEMLPQVLRDLGV